MSDVRRRLLIPALLLAVFLPAAGLAARLSVSIENISSTPHGARAGSTIDEIGGWIEYGAFELGWRPIERAEGRLTLVAEIRKHRAIVDVRFDEDQFTIDYKGSQNLNFSPEDLTRVNARRRIVVKGPRIHPNYNRWVRDLADQIRVRVAYPVEEPVPRISGPPQPIADELDKLDGLRMRGILTAEEFEARKARLLAE